MASKAAGCHPAATPAGHTATVSVNNEKLQVLTSLTFKLVETSDCDCCDSVIGNPTKPGKNNAKENIDFDDAKPK